jgi:prepilin-type N-terminal cleavage/methylation domain-containing protein
VGRKHRLGIIGASKGPFLHSMRRSNGFTLVEIVVVLLIFGIVLAMAAAITRGVVASQKRSLTATRIAAVDAALVQFVMQQRRLPCPADGTKPSADNNAGIEIGPSGTCNSMATGVVPWRALGLSETEASDGWDHRLTYRVDPALTADSGMDMSGCDVAGTESPVSGPTGCTAGCTFPNLAACTPPAKFLSGPAAAKGLPVRNLTGTVLMNPAVWVAPPNTIPNTGAAYVVISAGESGGGSYGNSGVLVAFADDGTEEQKNYANLPYVAGATYYVDDTTSAVPHFDDFVSHPSIMSVVSKAGLAPRTH